MYGRTDLLFFFFPKYLTLILKALFKFPSIMKSNELDICDPATLYKPNINHMHLWIKKIKGAQTAMYDQVNIHIAQKDIYAEGIQNRESPTLRKVKPAKLV